MAYKVAIINNRTKEMRFWHSTDDWDDESDVFYWTEGNMSCDCNRRFKFNGVADFDHSSCGESEFSCPFVQFEDGSRVELDEPIKAAS